MKAEDLKDSKLWWEGPQFLTDPYLELPEFMHNEEDLDENVMCKKKVTTLAVQAREIRDVEKVIDTDRYSSVLKCKEEGDWDDCWKFRAESFWIGSVREDLKQQKNYQ